MTDLLKDKTYKVLISMSLPISIGMLSILLFQVIDTYFVGQLGAQPLAALGFTSTIYFLFVALFISLSVDVSIIVGKSVGQKARLKVKKTIRIAIAIGLLLSVFCFFVFLCFFAWMRFLQHWGSRPVTTLYQSLYDTSFVWNVVVDDEFTLWRGVKSKRQYFQARSPYGGSWNR